MLGNNRAVIGLSASPVLKVARLPTHGLVSKVSWSQQHLLCSLRISSPRYLQTHGSKHVCTESNQATGFIGKLRLPLHIAAILTPIMSSRPTNILLRTVTADVLETKDADCFRLSTIPIRFATSPTSKRRHTRYFDCGRYSRSQRYETTKAHESIRDYDRAAFTREVQH